VAMFTIGGLSGVTHSIVPHNYQQTDTYWVVAHFHYVLFGGAMFGLVSGIYYWFPKVTGKLLSEKLGKMHFWTWFVGFNLTFGPMHMSGLLGQPRRTAVLPGGLGETVALYNLLSTVGALVLIVSSLIFLVNLIKSIRGGEPSGNDPWDARTLEWMTDSPTPEVNFYEIPVVEHRDEFWHRKYAEDESGVLRAIPVVVTEVSDADADTENAGHGHIHMPDPSYWPLIMTAAFLPFGYGVVYKSVPLLLGAAVWMFAGFYGWILEPLAAGDDD
jgi:cytochrome c oxidase subunit 1